MDKCRICFEGGNLISPCSCSGSLKFIHSKCLEKRKNSSQRIQCEICLDIYSTIPSGLVLTSIFIACANYLIWFMSIQVISAYIFSFRSFWTSLLPGIAFLTLRRYNLFIVFSILTGLVLWEFKPISLTLALTGNFSLLCKIIKRTKRLYPRLLMLLVEFNRNENDY